MTIRTNQQRADRAGEAITKYGDDDGRSNLVDLLTDTMHWCDHNSENFHFALSQACSHYINELNDDQQDERRLS